MPPFPSPTSYALLGLLSVRSWTTYELAQQVRRSLRWFWPRAERQLYDAPKRLVAAGLADVEERYVGRRRSRDYTITEAGREALASWLSEPPDARTTEFAAMVKVFFADAGDRGQLLTTLQRVEEEAAGRVAELRELSARPTAFPERRHLQALALTAMLDQEEAVLRWARWAGDQVTTWESSTDPAAWDPAAQLAVLVSRADDLLGPA